MDSGQLIKHLSEDHGIDEGVAREVIAGAVGGFAEDETYLRGFHDGLHGRVDADDIEFPEHDHDLEPITA